MNLYLSAGADAEYKASAYAFIVGNFPVRSDRRLGWTVVEAYAHGLLDASNYIISNHLYGPVKDVVVCTPSKYVLKLVSTDYIQVLHDNGWKSLDGKHVFYLPVLKELYYHRIFYKEREISWSSAQDVTEAEYHLFERCQEKLKMVLEVKK